MIPVVVMEENQQLPNSNIYYMIGENGQFIRKKIGLIDCVVPVSKISVLQKIKPYAKLNIPKISEEVFAKVVSFFREVYNLYRSESIVLLYYNENAKSKYLIHVPFQKVKGSSIDYLRANTIKDYTLVCSIHSHSDFGAFHSGTDTNDEKDFDGLHITVGNLADQMVSIVSSIAINGFRVTTDPIDYIEGIDIAPEEDEDSGPFYLVGGMQVKFSGRKKKEHNRYVVPLVNHSDDWLDRVEGTLYTPPQVTHYQTGYGFFDDDSFFDGFGFRGDNFRQSRGFTRSSLAKEIEEKKKDERPEVCKACPFGEVKSRNLVGRK